VFPLHLRIETDPVSETSCFYFVEHRTMEKVQKPSNSVCYTPSSEPFRITNKCLLNILNVINYIHLMSLLHVSATHGPSSGKHILFGVTIVLYTLS
jgi:hypothetical protein